MKSYLGNSIHLLSSMTQPAMTAFTLRRLRASAAFLGPFNHLTKKLMRIGLKLYGSEEAGPRLQVKNKVPHTTQPCFLAAPAIRPSPQCVCGQCPPHP
jgi:hypothetical protein